jgi:predicted adenylyl cyclase CyaB
LARNIEIKARIQSDEFGTIRERALGLAPGPPEVLYQTDTFFNIPKGRLKLRESGDGTAELIFYERPDQVDPKPSSYTRSPSLSPKSLYEALNGALGIRGVVKKRREVFLVGHTRIHLDEVEALGTFLELEVVLREDQSDPDGEVIAQQLLRELGVRVDCLIATAYIDLLDEIEKIAI